MRAGFRVRGAQGVPALRHRSGADLGSEVRRWVTLPTRVVGQMLLRCVPRRPLVFFGLLTLLLANAGKLYAQPDPNSVNLSVFTSPIDVTGLPFVMRVSAPDRESGRLVDIAVPPSFLPPKFSQLLAVPLSAQFDRFWSVDPDPERKKTVRASACDDPGGIKDRVAAEVAKLGKKAHDITCNLASSGQVLAKQIGSTVILAYLLKNNAVTFQSTSAQTCSPANGSIFCPNDPRFTVKFAIEIVTVVRAGGICELFGGDGQVFIQGASFESHNAAAEIARFFAGQRFVAAEVAMTNTMRKQPLPLDAAFKELRSGDLCARRLPGADRILFAFREFQPEIDLSRGIVLHATHAGILAPVLDVVQPTPSGGLPTPNVPSFFRPTISTAQPLIRAGDTVPLHGQHFPTAVNLATELPVGLDHDDRNPSVILGAAPGGVCFNGGGTDFEFGPVGGPLRIDRLPATAKGACASGITARPLSPATSYQFRARDCDPFTCSPWSAIARATTARIDPSTDVSTTKVWLELDRQVALGFATIDGKGNFDTPITIPAGTLAGAHNIRAALIPRDAPGAVAEAAVQVAAVAGGKPASIMVVGLLAGETGCPNHPLTSTQTDDTFLLFGAGLAAGTVAFTLDNAGGFLLGTAVVRPDGSICQRMRSPPANMAGPHVVVATQGGTLVARTNVNFVAPSGPR